MHEEKNPRSEQILPLTVSKRGKISRSKIQIGWFLPVFLAFAALASAVLIH
jgi:hypothetical protein